MKQLSLELGKRRKKLRPGEVESWARKLNISPLWGIDEVGVGPLAGPVVAACVALPENRHIRGLNDSKKLTEAQREKLFGKIKETATTWGVGIVDAATIDEMGIAPATFAAMKNALAQALERGPVAPPGLVVVDGRRSIPDLPHPQKTVVKGDARSWTIAAASVLAKVTRDRLLVNYDATYPEYGFAAHKGYGTKLHLEALRKHGPCPIHRRSFAPCAENSKL